MILVDTSVWVAHLRAGDRRLAAELNAGSVCVHPFVIGELACGNIRNRQAVLALLHELATLPVATDAEARTFIEKRALMARGIGYVDVHLLASASLSGTSRLWSRDRKLSAVAADLGLGYPE